MNREIKFRAWDTENVCFWYSDSTNDQEYCEAIIAKNTVYFKYAVYTPYQAMGEVVDSYSEETFEPQPEFVNQYTGLKDKNGKEIYEGDIMNYGNGRVFYVSYVGVQFIATFNERVINSMIPIHNFEIIGNIYQNPELLNA